MDIGQEVENWNGDEDVENVLHTTQDSDNFQMNSMALKINNFQINGMYGIEDYRFGWLRC